MSSADGAPLFALTEEHRAIREAVRALCEAKVAPYAADVDEHARYPDEAAAALLASDFSTTNAEIPLAPFSGSVTVITV